MDLKKLQKLKLELRDLLFDYELYRRFDMEECEEGQYPINFVGVYVLNSKELLEPTQAFSELDVERIVNEIILIIKKVK